VIGVMSQGILESTCLSCLLGFFLALALDVVISAEGEGLKVPYKVRMFYGKIKLVRHG
jgi:hypothetical protein